MTRSTPTFTFGIAEEYSLVDVTTRGLATETPPKLLSDLKTRLGDRFSTEFMRSQIEVGTSVHTSIADARAELIDMRKLIAKRATLHGLAPMAASTHPFSRWGHQHHRDTPRYNEIAESFRGLGRRMVVNGLHVHVGIEDDNARIEVMNDMRAFLPTLLALSGSSPFWEAENTGLKSYRTAINEATPRKGIPEDFANWGDFERTMHVLVSAGVMEDASKVWWDLRPSIRFPTLEMRITDVCPKVEDGICLAAIYRCLCRYLYRTRRARSKSPALPLFLINENRWRAERYGVSEGLIDFATGRVEPFIEVVEGLLDLIAEDASFFGCEAEAEHAMAIATRGTSSDRQLARYRKLRKAKLTHRQALKGVVDGLLEETVSDPALRHRPAVSKRDSLALAA